MIGHGPATTSFLRPWPRSAVGPVGLGTDPVGLQAWMLALGKQLLDFAAGEH